MRLASKLTNCTINIFGKTEAKDKKQHERADLITMFNDALDVDDDISELLIDNGFSSLEEVAYVDVEDLLVIEDFDEDVAKSSKSELKIGCYLKLSVIKTKWIS